MDDEVRISIRSEEDIVIAREQGRLIARKVGFDGSDLTLIPTAISEMARNILQYAKVGEIIICPYVRGDLEGIHITARDRGPGIADVDRAMQDGFSTGKGLGIGLPGTRRLMDEFEITSKVGKGTTVRMVKWL